MLTTKFGRAGIAMAAALFSATAAQAGVDCPVTDFHVQSNEDGSAYVYGLVGQNRVGLSLCTGTGTTPTCDSRGTDRNVGIATTALASGRPLWIYVGNVSSCAEVSNPTRPAVWVLR